MRTNQRILFLHRGESYPGYSLKHGTDQWIHVEGRSLRVENQTSTRQSRKAKSASTADPLRIRAPMPGKITSIRFQQGEVVEAGQVVLTMEAMKMEYNLKAGITGKVIEVKVAVGQQVGLGDLLLRFEGTL